MLVSQPDLLILDEPFEGLDVQSVAAWKTLLNELAADTTIILITNRLSDLPEAVSHIALLDQLSLSLQGEKSMGGATSCLFSATICRISGLRHTSRKHYSTDCA